MTVGPDTPPPVGWMGGSIHGWERGVDPFSRQCMPDEFKQRFPDKPPATGWFGLDWCGSAITFVADGTVVQVQD